MRFSFTARSRARALPSFKAYCLFPLWLQVVWLGGASFVMDDMVVLGHWTAAMLRSSTPLLMVTLGETLTQRVGIINLGVEGQMLGGACTGFAVAAITGDPLI